MATAERPGLPARSLASAETAHAREGFDKLSPNGSIATAERTGAFASSLASVQPVRARMGFDKLSPNGRVATAERPRLPGPSPAHASMSKEPR